MFLILFEVNIEIVLGGIEIELTESLACNPDYTKVETLLSAIALFDSVEYLLSANYQCRATYIFLITFFPVTNMNKSKLRPNESAKHLLYIMKAILAQDTKPNICKACVMQNMPSKSLLKIIVCK